MINFEQFFLQKDVQDAVKKKTKDIQEKGFVDKDFEMTVDGKRVKFMLPNDVRKQMHILNLYQRLMFQDSLSLEDLTALNIEYAEHICKHMLIDGEEVRDLNLLSLEEIKAYGLVYFLELLLPLFHRSSTKTEQLTRQVLGAYLNK